MSRLEPCKDDMIEYPFVIVVPTKVRRPIMPAAMLRGSAIWRAYIKWKFHNKHRLVTNIRRTEYQAE